MNTSHAVRVCSNIANRHISAFKSVKCAFHASCDISGPWNELTRPLSVRDMNV